MARFSSTVLLLLAVVLMLGLEAHGGWWFNKKTDMHRKAAVGHGKKAYHYGKEYAKDKATELEGRSQATYDKARAQAQAKAEEADKAMKQTKEKAEEKYDTLRDHAKKVVGKAEQAYDYTKDKAEQAAEAVKEAARNAQLEGGMDVDERVERTNGLFQWRHRDERRADGECRQKTFAERYAEEKAETEERQRTWSW